MASYLWFCAVVFATTARRDATSITDRCTQSFLINTSRLSEEQFPRSDAAPLKLNDPEFPGNGFPVNTNLSFGVSHETLQYLDFDSMCVPRVRGMGPAACLVATPREAVQHDLRPDFALLRGQL
jgi:hypothetical protein